MNTQSDNLNSSKKYIPTKAALGDAIQNYRQARDLQASRARYGAGAVLTREATDAAMVAADALTGWPEPPASFAEAVDALGFVREELEAEGPSSLTTLAGLTYSYFANYFANESFGAKHGSTGDVDDLGHLFDIASSMDNELSRIAAFVRMISGTSHLMSDQRDADAVDRMAEFAEAVVDDLKAMRSELFSGLHKYRFPIAVSGEVHHG